MEDGPQDYLTLQQASAYLGVTPAQLRRVLRSHGLGAALRAAAGKEVLLRRQDLDGLRPAFQQEQPRRGIA